MTSVRKRKTKSGKYEAWFITFEGKCKFFTGTRNRTETLRIAGRLEDEHRQIRLGYRPKPQAEDQHRERPFAALLHEYLEWGAAQGGRKGWPWSSSHLRNKRRCLAWWGNQLSLHYIGDLYDLQSQVEAKQRQLIREGRTGKTISNYTKALTALCDWAMQRRYLSEDPLKGLAPLNATPQTVRRALTADEIRRVIQAAPEHHGLLIATAICSGLRLGELRQLTTDHLDVANSRLILDADWTKNHEDGFQPLPSALVRSLAQIYLNMI